MTTATLCAPKVRYTSTFESQFDAMNTWRAVISRSAMGVHHDQDETCTLTPCTVVAGLSTGVPRRAVWTQVLPWMSAMGLFSSW